MAEHNKISFVREYCLCRRIPYKIRGEQLVIGNDRTSVIFSVYNLTYKELVECIDSMVEYDMTSTFYVRMK